MNKDLEIIFDEEKENLPINYVTWKCFDLNIKEKDTDNYVSVDKYATSKFCVYAFYKPISKMINNIYNG